MGKYNNVTEESPKKKKGKYDYDLVRAESKRRAKKKKEAAAKDKKESTKNTTETKKKFQVKHQTAFGAKIGWNKDPDRWKFKKEDRGTSLMKKGKGDPKDTLTASDRAIKNPNSKSNSGPADKLKKTRAQRGLGDMSMGGRRDLGKGTGRAGENDATFEPTTGSVTTKGKWGKSSKKNIRNAKTGLNNTPLGIPPKRTESAADKRRKSLHEEMTALKNKRAKPYPSSGKLKKDIAKAKSSGDSTVKLGNKTLKVKDVIEDFKVPKAKSTSLKGIGDIVARKRKEEAKKKKRKFTADSKRNRREREKAYSARGNSKR